MKQNASETESNQHLRKNVKKCLQTRSVSDTAFKAWPFSSNFNFVSRDDQVTAATYKYCPLVVSPTVTNFCKELHLTYSKIYRSVFEKVAMHEN